MAPKDSLSDPLAGYNLSLLSSPVRLCFCFSHDTGLLYLALSFPFPSHTKLWKVELGETRFCVPYNWSVFIDEAFLSQKSL